VVEIQSRLTSALALLSAMIPSLALAQDAPATSREPQAAAADIRQSAAAVEARWREAQALLQLKEVSYPAGAISGYDLGQVETTAESAKRALLDQLASDDLAALRAYVEAEFSDAGKDLRVLNLRGETLATRESTVQVSEKISGLFTRLKKLDTLVIRLRLAVTPGEALVELWPAALPSRKTPFKAGDVISLYRGLYEYRVVKHGYKAVESRIDFVEQTGSALECKLYELQNPDGPYPCSFK
jgi:hypothetical protein